MRLFKQLLGVFAVLLLLGGILMVFTYDIIKIDWVVFMEVQPAYGTQKFDPTTGMGPLPVPARSIPVEGPAYISGNGAPANPVPADEVSLSRGKQLFDIHCATCHGTDSKGTGLVAGFFTKKKPADLTSPAIQSLSDGTIFMVISDGFGFMPALNENFLVRERWDIVNYVRTFAAPK